MILEDFHMHTTFCDGANTPEEMVQAAIRLGMKRIGFSAHAPVINDDSDFAMKKVNAPLYRAEIARLKEAYADKIQILCGIEQDLLAAPPDGEYDYVIGSLHSVEGNGRVYEVDASPEEFQCAIDEGFDGDVYALCENYFQRMATVCEVLHPDIIGHFDLLTKFNEKHHFFDESHPRYIAAWQGALDKLLPYQVPFEINSGAMSRGWRTAPYPAKPILEYIFQKGGRVVLNSDSHSTKTLAHRFDLSEEIAREAGFREFKFK
ncbi:MAG: histidinol-phosphatase [Clostridia bacterium]|nr:histidinol-phosphatase [Clostridia bacterium]